MLKPRIIQTFPDNWNANSNQAAALASVGDDADMVMFDAIIIKGMSILNAMKDGGVNGIRMTLRDRAARYFSAAQEFSRLQHQDRAWEDYFPWIVFRNRFMGNKIDWVIWAAEKYGDHYVTTDINTLIKEWREQQDNG